MEFLQYLVSTKSLQKLNSVLSECLQQMPNEIDFWLVGVYADLELKGNMFSSRQLMLQGLRLNEHDSQFHLEYLRFELNFFHKIMKRREHLTPAAVQFVNDCDQIPGETKSGDEANFVQIVWANLLVKFEADALVLQAAKAMLKASVYLRQSAPQLLQQASDAVRRVKSTEEG